MENVVIYQQFVGLIKTHSTKQEGRWVVVWYALTDYYHNGLGFKLLVLNSARGPGRNILSIAPLPYVARPRAVASLATRLGPKAGLGSDVIVFIVEATSKTCKRNKQTNK